MSLPQDPGEREIAMELSDFYDLYSPLALELSDLYSLSEVDLPESPLFHSFIARLQAGDVDWDTTLSSIPPSSTPSLKPLSLFSNLVSEWTRICDQPHRYTLSILRCHERLIKTLPESARAGNPTNDVLATMSRAEKIADESYGSLLHFLSNPSQDPALRFSDNTSPISHAQLSAFIGDFASRFPIRHNQGSKKPVVAIVLPNGPLVAAAVMAVTVYYVAAPVNPGAGRSQVIADIVQAGSTYLLTTKDEFERLGLTHADLENHNVQLVLVELDSRLNMTVVSAGTSSDSNRSGGEVMKVEPNAAGDIGLVLFTSGTSGAKKVVPITVRSIVQGVLQVVDSWGLTVDDACLNMMPLFHVGGLIRNVFAPIVSGGSTICCPSFDSGLFWDIASRGFASWYYASPTMHALILDEAVKRPNDVESSRLRLVCNAAGALLPSLANQLRDTFGCVVLPSYGMTECMPISTPPLSYTLSRPGTSGITTGPEIAILSASTSQRLGPGAIGHVGVRGAPTFSGYLLPSGELDRSGFTSSGFFDTGDVGYLDQDGYLYITGRSKEVINRGGEVISPFEIEDAVVSSAKKSDSPIYGRVSAAAAFSVTHDVLQEVVGIAVVTPPGRPKVDIRSIHDAIADTLQKAKWPVAIVYVDELPRKGPKVVRIGFAMKMGLPQMTDHTLYSDKHWQLNIGNLHDNAKYPPATKCELDPTSLEALLKSSLPKQADSYIRFHVEDGTLEVVLAPRLGMASPEVVASLAEVKTGTIRDMLREVLDNFLIPHHFHVLDEPLPRVPTGEVDEETVHHLLEAQLEAELGDLEKTIPGRVKKIFASILNVEPHELDADLTFFQLGGDSLLTGRLLSALRSEFLVSIPLSLLFSSGSINVLSAHIEARVSTDGIDGKPENEPALPGCAKTHSSASPLLMMIQLLPLIFLYPLRRAFQWTLFMVALSFSQSLPTMANAPGRLLNLTVSIAIARAITRIIFPLLGICIKWVVIGRYKAGIYPMWGLYHTRWWLVQKAVDICGVGFFGVTNTGRILYLRLMGARIGKDVRMEMVKSGEWDLLDIGDEVILEKCVVRPFAAERNTSMLLAPIVIGSKSSVGLASIIAAGANIPPYTHIGPNSSSWEIQDAKAENADLLQDGKPKPHWVLQTLFTVPLFIVTEFIALVPWLIGLLGLVIEYPSTSQDPLYAILLWFTHPKRIAYHYLALALRAWLSPFAVFGFVVLVKLGLDRCFGKIEKHNNSGLRDEGTDKEKNGDRTIGAVERWRMSLMNTLLPTNRLHDMTGMMGSHYEGTSKALRLLGAKVGERVYWPGTGPSIGDYHLLDIGSDVVFGSRSHLVTSDRSGSERVVVGHGSMIADRVALLPGVTVGQQTTLGSGALTRRGAQYGPGGTFVGSKGGDSVCLTTGSSIPSKSKYDGMLDDEKKVRRTSSFGDNTDYSGTIPVGTMPSTPLYPCTTTLTTASTTPLTPTTPTTPINTRTTPSTPVGFGSKQSLESMTTQTNSMSERRDGISPFGRAFYLRQAPYFVFPSWMITAYSTSVTILVATFWNVPSITSIQIAGALFTVWERERNTVYDPLTLFGISVIGTGILTLIFAVVALGIVILSKWVLVGRRREGNYDWDKSSYCQRWQLFLTIERLRRHCFRGNGVLGMLTGTEWIVIYFRLLGAKIGNDVALFANGSPSLMFTEPELLDIGNRVVVDDASVVAHINTRGKFDLNALKIGDRAVMRTGSRLLSGAQMEKDSCLLEHTLVMGGDVVDDRWTMQGWPADKYDGDRLGR